MNLLKKYWIISSCFVKFAMTSLNRLLGSFTYYNDFLLISLVLYRNLKSKTMVKDCLKNEQIALFVCILKK